jgi:hypothetical protein
LPAPKRSPTTFMPSMSGPSMTSRGRGWRVFCRAFLGVVFDELVDALDEGVREALLDGGVAPGEVFFGAAGPLRGAALASGRSAKFHEALGGVGAAVEDHVLDRSRRSGSISS